MPQNNQADDYTKAQKNDFSLYRHFWAAPQISQQYGMIKKNPHPILGIWLFCNVVDELWCKWVTPWMTAPSIFPVACHTVLPCHSTIQLTSSHLSKGAAGGRTEVSCLYKPV